MFRNRPPNSVKPERGLLSSEIAIRQPSRHIPPQTEGPRLETKPKFLDKCLHRELQGDNKNAVFVKPKIHQIVLVPVGDASYNSADYKGASPRVFLHCLPVLTKNSEDPL
jgi:hypothetical protein